MHAFRDGEELGLGAGSDDAGASPKDRHRVWLNQFKAKSQFPKRLLDEKDCITVGT